MAMSWCQPSLNSTPIEEQGINVEAAENVFKSSMRKIETGRRTRGGIQLEKSLMIAMIALKARRYIWEEHMQCYMALRQTNSNQSIIVEEAHSVAVNSTTSISASKNGTDLESYNAPVYEELTDVEVNSKTSDMELNRKRPSSASDSDSDSDDDLDAVFLSPASPNKRSRRDQLFEIDEISDDDSNTDDSFTSPVITQLVTSFDNLLSDDDNYLNHEFDSNDHDTQSLLSGVADVSFIPLSCSLTINSSMTSNSFNSQSQMNACVS